MGWTQIVLLLDLTYTAFLVPILVGFEVSDVDWGYGKSHILLSSLRTLRLFDSGFQSAARSVMSMGVTAD